MSLIRFQPTELTTWTPLDRLVSLREEMNRLFDASLPGRDAGLFAGWSPMLDVYDDQNDFLIFCELPGMKKEEIELSIHDGTLTISGERKPASEVQGEVSRSERPTGKFQRSVTFPTRVNSEKVTASYQDGILCITLPKAEEAKPKQIAVNVS